MSDMDRIEREIDRIYSAKLYQVLGEDYTTLSRDDQDALCRDYRIAWETMNTSQYEYRNMIAKVGVRKWVSQLRAANTLANEIE